MFIIKNCPAREDILEITDWVNDKPIYKVDTPDYCCRHKKVCSKVDDCVIKNIIRNKNTAVLEIEEL